MRRIFWIIAAAALAGAGFLDAGGAAQAKQRNAPRPLIVKKRNFLDAGVVAPVGYGTNYVTDSTYAGRTPYSGGFSSDRFGGGNLPTRFSAPGRAAPIATFYTPAF